MELEDIENMEPGETYLCQHYNVHRRSDGVYELDSLRSGYKHHCDNSHIVHSIINSGSWTQASGALIGTSIGTVFGPGGLTATTFPSLSAEERKELETLEQEHKVFVKGNRLKKFQNLPKHLRQEIVDECYIRDLIAVLASDDDKDFQDMQKLQDLRNKNNNHYTGLSGLLNVTSGYSMVYGEAVGKYALITKHFTTEELAQAHAQACLEEAIQ